MPERLARGRVQLHVKAFRNARLNPGRVRETVVSRGTGRIGEIGQRAERTGELVSRSERVRGGLFPPKATPGNPALGARNPGVSSTNVVQRAVASTSEEVQPLIASQAPARAAVTRGVSKAATRIGVLGGAVATSTVVANQLMRDSNQKHAHQVQKPQRPASAPTPPAPPTTSEAPPTVVTGLPPPPAAHDASVHSAPPPRTVSTTRLPQSSQRYPPIKKDAVRDKLTQAEFDRFVSVHRGSQRAELEARGAMPFPPDFYQKARNPSGPGVDAGGGRGSGNPLGTSALPALYDKSRLVTGQQALTTLKHQANTLTRPKEYADDTRYMFRFRTAANHATNEKSHRPSNFLGGPLGRP